MDYYHVKKPIPLKHKILCVLVVCLLGFLIISLILYLLQRKYEYKRKAILENPANSIGFVFNKTSYKGHGFDVEYFVNEKRYVLKDDVSEESYRKYKSGDSIKIIYNRLAPSQAILLEDLNKSNGRNNSK